MLSIVLKTDTSKERLVTFHLLEHKTNEFPIGLGKINEVLYIQAEGKELKWILEAINGIPHTRMGTQRWYGDQAKYIVSSIYEFWEILKTMLEEHAE